MKALTLLTAAALTLLSVASSYAQYTGYPYGKGKAPPRRQLLRKARERLERVGGPAIVPVPFFLDRSAR